jgi:putative transcriptional regulator
MQENKGVVKVTRIEFTRRQIGLTQIALSRMIGVHATIIGQVEKGDRRSWPKLRRQYSDVLKLSESELFDKRGWPLSFD